MLGQVEVPDDPPYVLTLENDRVWSASWPEAEPIAVGLNLAHQGTWGEWAGKVGAWQLADAAQRLNGRVL